MKKIFLFICLILMFVSCGKFDRKKYSNKDLKNWILVKTMILNIRNPLWEKQVQYIMNGILNA